MEIKDLPGYEGLYAVSTKGDVYSLPRKIIRSNGIPQTLIGRKMRPNTNKKTGYSYLVLNAHGASKTMTVHRCIALAFVENPEQKPYINHKDGNKTNNHANNLEWVTRSENERHKFAVLGYKSPTYGKVGAASKKSVPVLQLDPITGEVLKRYAAYSEARADGFLTTGICNCINGRTKVHGGFKWRKESASI